MRKPRIRAYRAAFAALIMFIVLISAVNWLLNHASTPNEEKRVPVVSEQVRQYEPVVERYAVTYGVSEYRDVLLSIMMQESGGRGEDPMQSSESRCGQPGCIKDPEQSIKSGVQHFAGMLEEADGDLPLAVQAYNFGRGFIPYAKEKTGGYTEETARNFSKEMYAKAKDKEKYRCLRPEAKAEKACYGDMYYVDAVMRYRSAFEKN